MKKSISSLLIGLFIIIFGFLTLVFLSTRGGPRYPIDFLGMAALFVAWIVFSVVILLSVFGLILGMRSLKQEINKTLSTLAVIANALGFIICLAILVTPMAIRDIKARGKVLWNTQEIQGHVLLKGTRVKFDTAGNIREANLAHHQEIQGIMFPKGTTVGFSTGVISSAYLVKTQEIQGIKCAAGSTVGFLTAKKLSYATLAEDSEMRGTVFPKGTTVYFGDWFLAEFPSTYKINNILCTSANFDELGKVRQVELAEKYEVHGKIYSEGQRIEFDESGDIVIEQ